LATASFFTVTAVVLRKGIKPNTTKNTDSHLIFNSQFSILNLIVLPFSFFTVKAMTKQNSYLYICDGKKMYYEKRIRAIASIPLLQGRVSGNDRRKDALVHHPDQTLYYVLPVEAVLLSPLFGAI
jgi:hypothetical protein